MGVCDKNDGVTNLFPTTTTTTETKKNFLQFVNPSHLDMHCLVEDENEGTETKVNDDNKNGHNNDRKRKKSWRTRFEKPIATLKTLPINNSPSQMLSCIL